MKMIILWSLVRINMIEKIEQLRNNPHIKDNINKYNYEREIVGDEIFQNLNMRIAHLISDKVMLLMLDLGIPIGIVEAVDEKGNISTTSTGQTADNGSWGATSSSTRNDGATIKTIIYCYFFYFFFKK